MIVYEEGMGARAGRYWEEEKANGRRREMVEGSTRTRRICVSVSGRVEEDSLLGMDRTMTMRDDR